MIKIEFSSEHFSIQLARHVALQMMYRIRIRAVFCSTCRRTHFKRLLRHSRCCSRHRHNDLQHHAGLKRSVNRFEGRHGERGVEAVKRTMDGECQEVDMRILKIGEVLHGIRINSSDGEERVGVEACIACSKALDNANIQTHCIMEGFGHSCCRHDI
jgi:hypothetical protein